MNAASPGFAEVRLSAFVIISRWEDLAEYRTIKGTPQRRRPCSAAALSSHLLAFVSCRYDHFGGSLNVILTMPRYPRCRQSARRDRLVTCTRAIISAAFRTSPRRGRFDKVLRSFRSGRRRTHECERTNDCVSGGPVSRPRRTSTSAQFDKFRW